MKVSMRLQRSILRGIFAALTTLFFGGAFAADFYVATDGNDGNPGTSALPFATIGAAITAADAAIVGGGDGSATIHVADGTYPENSLTLANPITIVGNVSDRAAVKIGGNSASRVFELSGAGATLSCLTVQGGTTQKTQDGGGVYMTGNGVVTNCVVTGVSGKTNYHGLNIYMTDGLVVDSEISSGATAQVCNGMNLYMSGGRAMRCEIKDAVGTTGNSFALYMDGGIAESCLVTGSKTRRGAVFVAGAGARLVNCSIIKNTYCNANYQNCLGIRVENANARVVNCVIYDNGGTAAKEWNSANAACFVDCAFSADAAYSGTASTITTLTDAAFKDYAGGDYRPAPGGLLVDAGGDVSGLSPAPVSATDLDGNTRLSGVALDIGCYELDQNAPDFTVPFWGAVNGVDFVFTPLGGASGNVRLRWDFDDGGEPVESSGSTTVTHAFSQSKIHHVSLSVSTDNGATWSNPTVHDIVTAPSHIYVDASGVNPVFPYATAATAALTIADAYAALTNTTSHGATDMDGVTLHVAAGDYPENDFRLDSAVTFVGDTSDRAAVKIGGNSVSRVFELSGAGATLSCLTVQGGTTQKIQDGGGVYMTGACVVTNCVVTGANGKSGCKGINVYASNGLVVDSELADAYTAGSSNGMNLYMAGGRAMRCVIRDAACTTDNAFALYMDGGIAENCLVTGSKTRKGAVYVAGAGARLVNCSIIKNTYSNASYQDCLGINVANADARVVNCVIYDNGGTAAKEWRNANAACFTNCAFAASADYSGAASTVNDLTDADFKDYANGDYRPAKDGALVNAGTRWADYLSFGATSETDLAGAARLSGKFLDIGCYEIASGVGLSIFVR